MCRAPVVCSEDRLAHGRNTKQNRSSWFSAHFQCFVTCSLLQAMRPEMLALLQIRSRCCGTLTVQQSKCLALLSITWALGSKNAPRGFHQVLQKLWGSPEERFQQSFTLSSTRCCNMWLGLVGARLHHGAIGPWSGPDRAPDCTVGPRSGPDCAVGPRSGRDCAVTLSFALQSYNAASSAKPVAGRSARILGGCGAVGDIARAYFFGFWHVGFYRETKRHSPIAKRFGAVTPIGFATSRKSSFALLASCWPRSVVTTSINQQDALGSGSLRRWSNRNTCRTWQCL